MKFFSKLITAALVALALVSGEARAASTFTQIAPGTAISFFTSTEMASLGSGISIVSSTGCTSGVCQQSSFSISGPMWVAPFFKAGGAFGGAPGAGGNISCWFVNSNDGGTTFEKTYTGSTTQPALARNPDFIIPISTTNATTGDLYGAVGYRVLVPAGSFKIDCQNNLGVAFGSGNNNNIILLPSYYQGS